MPWMNSKPAVATTHLTVAVTTTLLPLLSEPLLGEPTGLFLVFNKIQYRCSLGCLTQCIFVLLCFVCRPTVLASQTQLTMVSLAAHYSIRLSSTYCSLAGPAHCMGIATASLAVGSPTLSLSACA